MEREVLENLRKEYSLEKLNEKDVLKDPIKQFSKWMSDAIASNVPEPNAMTLATSTIDRKPNARIVLLKGCDERGFIFYTNYLSTKGRELSKNPFASLVFFWAELGRQVRIEGTVEKLGKEESEKYFHSRPKESQIGALVSPQSQILDGRKLLEANMAENIIRFSDREVPKPANWGGYVVKPQVIEFWQGRENRLHDRIVFRRADKTQWKILRLAP